MSRVLVVEDSPTQAQMLHAILEAGGFEVEVAADGVAGLERIRERDFDAVLSDIMMPRMDGYELCKLLKSQHQTSRIPVLLVTTLDHPEDIVCGIEAGADNYVLKPFEPEQITRRVKAVLAEEASPGVSGEACTVTADREQLVRYLVAALDDFGSAKQRESESKRAAEVVLRMRDKFLSHISHELRSPLSAIHSFVTILLDGIAGELDPTQHEYLEIVFRNVLELESMISEVLEVTRTQAGELPIRPRRLDIADVAERAVDKKLTEADKKGVSLLVEVPRELPAVFADPDRVCQVLANLIDNAIKFTPEGGNVTVGSEVFAEDPSFVCVWVRDTGCGIAPEAFDTVFDLLYHDDETIDSSRRGLGLGLYMCKEFVTRHGGRIWVTSQPGQGATLRLTLPVFSKTDHTNVAVTVEDNEQTPILGSNQNV